MTTYRIYETGNDTGKKWFYAKQKWGWFWTAPVLDDLRDDLNGLCSNNSTDYCKRFWSKEELLAAIKEAHEKKSRREKSLHSIYHKIVDTITIPD
jgi:hypothetical protein